jgi:hypothetical protein
MSRSPSGVQRVTVAGPGGGAEVAQLKGDGLELRVKRPRPILILERHGPRDHGQAPDEQPHGFRFRLRLCGRAGKALAEVGKIQRAVGTYRGTHVGLLEDDLAKARSEPPQARQL